MPDLESKLGLSPSIADYDFATFRADPGPPARGLLYPPALFPTKPYVPPAELDDGILGEDCRRHEVELDPSVLFKECPFLRESYKTGGAGLAQGLWMNSVLAMTFLPHGDELAHKISRGYVGYSPAETDDMYQRKLNDREAKGLGWPSCKLFQREGSKQCATCKHFGKIKSPLNLGRPLQTPSAEPSFGDPYAEFVGPPFPFRVLSPTLAKFVDAEHRAMGADPSAIAMAALTTVAGAMHAETLIRAGEGWWERPILWTVLVGQPSTMKSPIIDKTKKPLSGDRPRAEKTLKSGVCKMAVATKGKLEVKNCTAAQAASLRHSTDNRPEKVAEILSRDPSGSLMVQDELAGWLGGFDRYSSGQPARAFYLQAWNGGPYTRGPRGQREGAM